MAELADFLKQVKNQGKTLVLATGVFDLLHQEHLNFLTQAKAEGDVLLVGLETDQRVKQLKGERRPIHNQQERLKQISAVSVVDQVFILPVEFNQEKNHLTLLKKIKPNVLAVSSHTPFIERKQKLMAQVGGTVKVVYKFQPHLSTTKILEQLRNDK